jgi:hypothetical protein
VRPEGLGKFIKIIHLIGSRTRDHALFHINYTGIKNDENPTQYLAWGGGIVEAQNENYNRNQDAREHTSISIILNLLTDYWIVSVYSSFSLQINVMQFLT